MKPGSESSHRAGTGIGTGADAIVGECDGAERTLSDRSDGSTRVVVGEGDQYRGRTTSTDGVLTERQDAPTSEVLKIHIGSHQGQVLATPQQRRRGRTRTMSDKISCLGVCVDGRCETS